MRINNGGSIVSLESIVLFPFDDHSIPFQHGVKLHLQGKQASHGNKPVVPLGEEGAHDSLWIAFYGTVLAIDGDRWRAVDVVSGTGARRTLAPTCLPR